MIKTRVWAQIIIIYTRYLLGATFVFSSIIKIKGKRFTSESGALNPIDTAWHFFETMYQSGLYWKFIGVCQLFAGLLLLTQKYSKLGALVNFPITLNIFVITLSYYFSFTPVITGLILMANIFLIIWDWNDFKILFNQEQTLDKRARLENHSIWQITGLVLFLFTLNYRLLVDNYDIIFWIVTCMMIGFVGLIMGLLKNKKQIKYLQHS